VPGAETKEIPMTEYMLSVHHEVGEDLTAGMTPEDMQRVSAAVDKFNAKLQETGAWVFAGGLMPLESSTTVRAHQGDEVLITDGPFAETKEYLGGFWVVEAADLDAALELARQGSVACRGAVEVRPFQGEPEG
jgi:hypothetical protein